MVLLKVMVTSRHFWVILGLISILLIFAELLDIAWRTKILYRNCQPEAITYESFDPYCVVIRQRSTVFSSATWLWITAQGNPDYGFAVQYPESTLVGVSDFSGIVTRWESDGVYLTTDLDLSLFVPAKNFIGGR